MAFSMSKQPSMAMACLLLLLLLMIILTGQASSHPQVVAHGARPRSLLLQDPPKIDCPGSCRGRCASNWMNEMCNELCVKCCNKCSCVPPGTGQDTRGVCPCYDTMVNPHTGKLKCP